MTATDRAGIESLTGWDTPALSNALDALRLRTNHIGYSDASIQRITGAGPMAGRAVTARMIARIDSIRIPEEKSSGILYIRGGA